MIVDLPGNDDGLGICTYCGNVDGSIIRLAGDTPIRTCLKGARMDILYFSSAVFYLLPKKAV